MAHEKGILNLLEKEDFQRSIAGKIAQTITQDEYESIFNDNPTSFYEKKAFVEMFRRKWREDKGFCSIFDKRQIYKQALQLQGKGKNQHHYSLSMAQDQMKNILVNISNYRSGTGN